MAWMIGSYNTRQYFEGSGVSGFRRRNSSQVKHPLTEEWNKLAEGGMPS